MDLTTVLTSEPGESRVAHGSMIMNRKRGTAMDASAVDLTLVLTSEPGKSRVAHCTDTANCLGDFC